MEKKKKPEIRFRGFNEDWEQRKFSDIVETRRGLTYKPSDICNNGIRVLRSSNIIEDSFILNDDDVFVKPEAINIEYARVNDILITAANGSSRLVGKHSIISKILEKSTVHGGFMLLGTTKEPYFINASMGSSWYKQFIELYVSGGNGSIGNLNKNDLDNQEIYIPSEEEQKKIGQYFKHLDDLITLHQRKLEKLQNFKKSMLEKMFPQNDSKTPQIRFKGFTNDWEQRKFNEIGIVIDPHPSHRAPKEVENGIPFIGIGDVDEMGNINKQSARLVSESIYDEHRRRYDLSIPSLGLGRVASLGKVIRLRSDIEKYTVSPTLSVLQFAQSINIDYTYAYMNSPGFKNQFESKSNGSTRQSVGTETVRILDLSIPNSMDEQQKIGTFFINLDHLITLHQRKLEKLQNIKKSMLEKMFV